MPIDLTVAKSICTCSHDADGTGSEHSGVDGKGACTKCNCKKFIFDSFLPEVEAAVKEIFGPDE